MRQPHHNCPAMPGDRRPFDVSLPAPPLDLPVEAPRGRRASVRRPKRHEERMAKQKEEKRINKAAARFERTTPRCVTTEVTGDTCPDRWFQPMAYAPGEALDGRRERARRGGRPRRYGGGMVMDLVGADRRRHGMVKALVAVLVIFVAMAACGAAAIVRISTADGHERARWVRQSCDIVKGRVVEGWYGDERVSLCVHPDQTAGR